MPTLKKGDLIKNGNGVTRKVIEVCGTILHMSFGEDHSRFNYTTDEKNLRADGYTWDTPAWEPEYGSIYWCVYINGKGEVLDSIWDNDETDHRRRDFLGIYQTKELAEAALLEIRRKLGK